MTKSKDKFFFSLCKLMVLVLQFLLLLLHVVNRAVFLYFIPGDPLPECFRCLKH